MPSLSALIEPRLMQLPRRLALQWPGGRIGAGVADVCLKLRDRALLLWLAQGRIGDLADAYVRGDLEIEGSLEHVMAVAAALVDDPVRRGASRWPGWLIGLLLQWRSAHLHSRHRDAAQVQSHYDLSDDFFALWLDPRRVYSCAYYADAGMSLAQAQEAKLDLVCRKLRLAPSQRFLDIGAGWGGLLLWAAKHYGVQACGITLSKKQHAHVSRLIDEQGLRGRVEIRLLDYRDLRLETEAAEGAAGSGAGVERGWDRIASVGMFEHVGRARLDDYFLHLRGLLRPGGLLLNHGIAAAGLENAELGAGMGAFIEKHIFPGGELVHVSRAVQALGRAGLELVDAEGLRPHYARTLWAWSRSLEEQLPRARELTDEATVRAYRLYLAGSAMCFEQGWLGLYQLLATRPDGHVEPVGDRGLRGAQSDYPFNRQYIY